MAPARPGVYPLLWLLLLGLWVAETPVAAKPKNMTSSQWFEIQHVQPSRQACSSAMGHINSYTKHCKNLNTFLHESFSSVATTCQNSNIACKNGHENCHQSLGPVSLTMCELTSGKYPNCKYKDKLLNAPYIVACDPPQKGDSGKFQLVPVHLDEVLQVSGLPYSLMIPSAGLCTATPLPVAFSSPHLWGLFLVWALWRG